MNLTGKGPLTELPVLCDVFADEVVTTHGPIEPDKENIRQEPYSLPQGFMWDTLDLSNSEVVRVCYSAPC